MTIQEAIDLLYQEEELVCDCLHRTICSHEEEILASKLEEAFRVLMDVKRESDKYQEKKP